MAGRLRSNEFAATHRLNPAVPGDRLLLREMVDQRRSAHTSFPPGLVEQLLDYIDTLDGVDSTSEATVFEDSPLERIADALEALVERSAGAGDGVAGQAPRPPTG